MKPDPTSQKNHLMTLVVTFPFRSKNRTIKTMKKKKLTVVASLQALPGKELELRGILMGFLAPTRQEVGCLNYDLHQSNEDPTKFLFHENWESREDLDRHLQSPHILAALPNIQKLWVKPLEVSFWEQIA